MENANQSITELLSITDIVRGILFKIPDYQRGYSWEEEQLNDLIKDIEHISAIDHKHYIGTIVITKNRDRYDIVDGQQRITTLIILLNLIYESNPERYSEIRELFIIRNDCDYVLELNIETNQFFKEAILGKKKNLPDDIKPLTNLKYAKNFLSKWLNGNTVNTSVIYDTVVHKLGFLCFSPQNTKEIGIMFEVINNRGKALSELEKIKNYFIYYSTINNKKRLQNKINENWGNILRSLSKAGVISNDEENSFLRNCYIVFYSANKSKSWYVYQELKELYKIENENEIDIDKKIAEIENFVDFIQKSAQAYSYLFNSAHFRSDYAGELMEELSNVLKRLRCHPVNASIMPIFISSMSYLYDRTSDVIALLRLIEILNFRIYVLFNINIPRADSRQGDLFGWARELYIDSDWNSENTDIVYHTWKDRKIDGDIFDYIRMHLEDFISVLCPEEVFVQALTINYDSPVDFFNWNGLRFFLASYEEHLYQQKKNRWDIEKILINRVELKKEEGNVYLSKEHIWAQNNRSSDFPPSHKEKRRLGNFVLLGLSSNIQLQDSSIQDKVQMLEDNSSIDMHQVNNLRKYLEEATSYASNFLSKKTKNFYLFEARKLIDIRENELIKFALKRWKMDHEKMNKFSKVDSFEAEEMKKTEVYFMK